MLRVQTAEENDDAAISDEELESDAYNTFTRTLTQVGVNLLP
jgi:hypothetical protein